MGFGQQTPSEGTAKISTRPGYQDFQREFSLECESEEFFQFASDKFEVLSLESWVHAQPKRLIHNDIGVGQVAADAKVLADHVWLSGQISGEQQAGSDLVVSQVIQ